MLPRQVAAGGVVGVILPGCSTEQRAQPGPGRHHVAAGHAGEQPGHRGQDVVPVGVAHRRVVQVALVRGVGRAGVDPVLPRDDEDVPPVVRRRRRDHRRRGPYRAGGEHQMDALARPQLHAAGTGREFRDPFGPYPGRVDHGPGPDLERLPGHLVGHRRPGHPALAEQAGHPRVVGQPGAGRVRGPGHLDGQPGVVRLALEVPESARRVRPARVWPPPPARRSPTCGSRCSGPPPAARTRSARPGRWPGGAGRWPACTWEPGAPGAAPAGTGCPAPAATPAPGRSPRAPGSAGRRAPAAMTAPRSRRRSRPSRPAPPTARAPPRPARCPPR